MEMIENNEEMIELVKLARFIGQRFDLVQAGGGNISLKINEVLWVKSSGMALSDLKSINHLAQLNLVKLKNDMQNISKLGFHDKKQLENHAKIMLNDSNYTPSQQPSIESFLHVFGYKYVVHTHPVLVNSIVICNNAQNVVAELFPESLFIDYYTPGVELAIAMQDKLNQHVQLFNSMPKLFFLKNHGVIVTADSYNEVIDIYEKISDILERFFNSDINRYKQVNIISQVYNEITGLDYISYLSEDYVIQKKWVESQHNFFIRPTSPDVYVYNGLMPCHTLSLDELIVQITEFIVLHNDYPKVIIVGDDIYFMAINIKKAHDMEAVFKFHILALETKCGEVNLLSNDEIVYLSNWDAEKYRQKL